MKLDSEVGTIESGKRADLIILDRNPLEQISNIRSIKTVITGVDVMTRRRFGPAWDSNPSS